MESVFHFTQSLRSYREDDSEQLHQLAVLPACQPFTILKKFLEQQDIAKFLVAAEVKDIIFNENDPDKIVSDPCKVWPHPQQQSYLLPQQR